MTNLSPAAQAILNAYGRETGDIDCVWHPSELKGLAAALRAAADEVVPPEQERLFIEKRPWDGELAAVVEIRQEILAIVDELEGNF
jgi:hypothetical protein